MSLTIPETETSLYFPSIFSQHLVEKFLASIDVKNNSKVTYRKQLKGLFEWINLKGSLNLDSDDLLSYKQQLIQEEKSPNTIANYIVIIRKFFGWLEESGIYPNIAKRMKKPKTPHGFRKECLTIDQVREALASFDTSTKEGLRDFAIFNLLVRTGLRSFEICNSLVEDIRQQGGQAILQIQGKSRICKDDFVVLLPETLKPIREYLFKRGKIDPKEPLFCSSSNRTYGQSLKERTVQWIIKTTLRRIHLDDPRITTHSLRHTAISLSIQNGASLVQAQAMARHNDPKTTMIYVHNHDRVKFAAEKLVII